VNFALSDDQLLLRDTARQLLADRCPPTLLRALAPAWRAAAAVLPRVREGAAIEDLLPEALGMSPVSVGFDARGLALPSPNAFTFDRQIRAVALPAGLAIGHSGLTFAGFIAPALGVRDPYRATPEQVRLVRRVPHDLRGHV